MNLYEIKHESDKIAMQIRNDKINMRSGATAIVPLLKLLCLTVIGLLLANPTMQFIPRATFKLLSKLVFALFLPCLISTELVETITLQNFIDWWFIPVNVLVNTALGCLLGFLVVLMSHPPPQLRRFTIIMAGFGNTGNLPLAVVGSVCHTKDNPFGKPCNTRGVVYVSFAQGVAVYHMMEPPLEYYEIEEEGVFFANGEGANCDGAVVDQRASSRGR